MSNEAHTDLLAELSHNLQTPLAILKTRIAQLRVGLVREGEMHTGLRGIDDSIDVLSRAINELLAASVHQSSERRHTPFSLSELLEELVEEADVIAELHGIDIRADILPDITVLGNPQELRESFMNILANAVKYIGSGPRKEICIALGSTPDNEAIATIADTGLGIAPEDLPHVFDRFYRSAHVYGIAAGTGLGLASAKRTIDAHAGRIEITSEVGVGTTVTVTLPGSAA